MKFYVHYGDAAAPCTLICRVTEEASVEALVQAFAQRYEAKFSRELDTTSVEIRDAKKALLPLKKRVGRVLNEGSDVFLYPSGTAPSPSTAPAAPSVAPAQPKTTTPTAKAEVYKETPLMKEFIKRGEKEESENYYRRAAEYYQKVLKGHPYYKPSLVRLMDLWRKVGRPVEAKQWCELGLSHYPDDITVLVAAGRLKHTCEDYEAAIQVFNKAIEIAKRKALPWIPEAADLEIYAANSMYALGGAWENPAVQFVMAVVEPERKHIEGLLLYARIAFDRGLVEDAVRVFLRLILQNQEHEEVKRYLADCFEKPGTFEFVAGELKTGAGLGSAFAFLAARIKDYGAIQPAVQLYEKALEIEPLDPSVALNYIHVLELLPEINKIVDFSMGFLKRCNVQLIRNLECRDIGKMLEEFPDLSQAGAFGCLALEQWTPHPQQDLVEEIVETVMRHPQQLAKRACLVVKVLFISGALERAYEVIQSVALCCKASAKELHTTTVRNEAAYFNCMRQILHDYPPPESPPPQSTAPLYLCGDSHCLSGAWQRIQLNGVEHLLVPKLVTGCKVWHLRKESRFYPKYGFEKTMQSIPNGSPVILNFGEIDCRTGIGLAVEKCKYDSQDEAIEKTVSIYIQVLKDLIRQRRFVIYVHPVPPALSVTRQMVKAYNAVLKVAVQELEARDAFRGRIYWLDFLDDLLSADGEELNPALQFDDTHLAPIYTQYLQKALNECHPEQD